MLLGLLVETYRKLGRPEEGMTVATEALALARQTGQRSHEIWLSWLKGELSLQSRQVKASQGKSEITNPRPPTLDPQSEAEEYFRQAMTIAQHQGARWLELRTATSLSRLWQQRGKQDEARQLLAEIYGWFTEGFDTVGLKEARGLLEELGG
jgi:hypothetical protein